MRIRNYFTLVMLLVSFGFIGFAAPPAHFVVSPGTTCDMSGNTVMTLGGNFVNNGTFTASGTSDVIFMGTTQEIIGGTGSTQFQNAEMNNSSNFQLNGHISVNSTLTLVAGTVNLGNFNLTLGSAATIAGTFGITKMIIADATGGNTGQLKKVYPTGASNFLFPIGDVTATMDYSPVTLNFTANSTNRTIGLNVVDTQHPNDLSPSNYISRYWNFTDNVCSGSYVYDATFTYSTTSPSDLVGNYNNVFVYWWNGNWNRLNTDRPGAPKLSVSGVNETTGSLCNTQYTGRACALPVLTNTIPDQQVCQGNPITFTAVATGSELSYQWKKGANNINSATNSTYLISNAQLTDYDVYTCNISNSCGSIDVPAFTLIVNSPPTSNVKFTNQIKYLGNSITFSLSPGGSSPFTFQWKKDGADIGGATNSSFTINSIVCEDSALYTCKISNTCNSITPKIANLFVLGCSRYKFAISGYVKYENKDSFAMSSHTLNTVTNVSLLTAGDTLIGRTETDDYGFYVITNIVNGNYKLVANTSKKWGGSNPVDALLVNRNYIGLYTIPGLLSIPPSLKTLAADVNLDTKINPTDALMINRRYIGLLSHFVDKDKVTVPDWLFSNPEIQVVTDDITKDIHALCTGDVNGTYSNIPAKDLFTPVSTSSNQLSVISDKFDIPVYLNEIADLGAIGVKLRIENGELRIENIKSELTGMIYNITEDGVNVAWSADNEGYSITPDKPLFYLTVISEERSVNVENYQMPVFMLNAESVLADFDANLISTDKITIPKLIYDVRNKKHEAQCNIYPNPFSNITNIDYEIPEDANVKLSIYNVLGEKIYALKDEMNKAGKYSVKFDGSAVKQGVYYCKIEAVNSSSTFSKTNIIMIVR